MCIKRIAEQKREIQVAFVPRYMILLILDFTVLYVALTTAKSLVRCNPYDAIESMLN